MRVAVRTFTSRRLRVAIAAALVACAPRASAPRDGEAHRIVSLSPAFTELLFAIGAGDRLVGRTAWCDSPAAALAVPSVGDGLAPNVEAIVARQPDLVVFYASDANAAARERLATLGIRTMTLPMDRLAHVAVAARLLGDVAGVRARADSLAARFTAGLDSARAAARTDSARRVLLLAWDQPPIVIGSGSFQHELVALAGGVNVFGDLPQPSAQVTIETIAARDPEVVLLLDGDAAPAWAERPEWQVVRAVRRRHFSAVLGTAFARPTLRALDAVLALRAALDSASR